LIAQAGKMCLPQTILGENGRVCVFETTAGDRFRVVEPKMSKESRAALIDVLREILEEETTVDQE
jgi:hypothetical protein